MLHYTYTAAENGLVHMKFSDDDSRYKESMGFTQILFKCGDQFRYPTDDKKEAEKYIDSAVFPEGRTICPHCVKRQMQIASDDFAENVMSLIRK